MFNRKIVLFFVEQHFKNYLSINSGVLFKRFEPLLTRPTDGIHAAGDFPADGKPKRTHPPGPIPKNVQ